MLKRKSSRKLLILSSIVFWISSCKFNNNVKYEVIWNDFRETQKTEKLSIVFGVDEKETEVHIKTNSTKYIRLPDLSKENISIDEGCGQTGDYYSFSYIINRHSKMIEFFLVDKENVNLESENITVKKRENVCGYSLMFMDKAANRIYSFYSSENKFYIDKQQAAELNKTMTISKIWENAINNTFGYYSNADNTGFIKNSPSYLIKSKIFDGYILVFSNSSGYALNVYDKDLLPEYYWNK